MAMLASKRFTLSRVGMLTFLNSLAAKTDSARTQYLPAGLNSAEIEKSLTGLPEDVLRDSAKSAAVSKTGVALFWSTTHCYLVLPPFPIKEKYSAAGYMVGPLSSLLESDFKLALVLVRLGAYAIGVCQGERLINSKVGTGLVHGRHRQGGSSAHRFERHRKKQIEYFLTRVCGHVREQLEPQARSLDYLVYGGARTTILLLQKHCPFLEQFDNHTLPPLLDIAEPRQAVLEDAISRVWSSTVIETELMV